MFSTLLVTWLAQALVGFYQVYFPAFKFFLIWFIGWRGFTLGTMLIKLVIFVCAFFFPRSPRFVYRKFENIEGRKLMTEFAEKSGRPMTEDELVDFERHIGKENIGKNAGKSSSLVDIFRDPAMTKVSVNIGVAFVVNVLVYYGLSYNVDSLSGNLYTNNAINGFVELIAYVLVLFLLDITGRRILLGGLMIFGGLACLGAMICFEIATSSEGTSL